MRTDSQIGKRMKYILPLLLSIFVFIASCDEQDNKGEEALALLLLLNPSSSKTTSDNDEMSPEQVDVESGSITFTLSTGDTRSYSYEPSCSGSTGNEDFYFFKMTAKGNRKLLIDFMGGGACWDGMNCFGDYTTTYYNQISLLTEYSVSLSQFQKGIFDLENENNPFYEGWDVIFVPYCTGDLHWGSKDFEYTRADTGEKETIRHHGFDNMLSVLAYIKSAYPDADLDQIFVAGQSAGGYGAAYALPYVKELYYDKKVSLLSDGASGVVTDDFLEDYAVVNWGIKDTFPDWIDNMDEDTFVTLGFGEYIKNLAEYYPDVKFGQYTTMFDGDQRYFYNVMKQIDDGVVYEDEENFWGDAHGSSVADATSCTWKEKMLDQLDLAKSASTGNFAYFIAPGDLHTITQYDDMYTVDSGLDDNYSFLQWLNALVQSDASLPDDYRCSEEECEAPVSDENTLNTLCP